MNPTDASSTVVKEITVDRSASRVFEALTDPQQRERWWGLDGQFQATHMESDLRPGGAWMMHGIRGGGQTFTVRGQYRAVVTPRLVEFTWLPDWEGDEPESLVRLDLDETDGLTTVRVTHSGLTSEGACDGYDKGWPWLLALLKVYVEDQPLD